MEERFLDVVDEFDACSANGLVSPVAAAGVAEVLAVGWYNSVESIEEVARMWYRRELEKSAR